MNPYTHQSHVPINLLSAVLISFGGAAEAAPASQQEERAVPPAYISGAMPRSASSYQFASLLDIEHEVMARMIEIASTIISGSRELDPEFAQIVDREFWNIR
jgi:hypothetical protein